MFAVFIGLIGIVSFIGPSWSTWVLIGVGITLLGWPLLAAYNRKAMSIRLCPKGITWGGSYQKRYLVTWEEVLAVKHLKNYPSNKAIALTAKAKKFIPQHDRLILLPEARMDEFIGAVMTYAPVDNPLRVYIQVRYLDPNTTTIY